MEELDIALIKRKSISGVVALTSRTFLLQVIAFVATFLLTLFLNPEIFGIFYVVSAIISFLGYFSDIGLAAALIQKKEELTDDDLSTTFTLQQILIGTAVILALLFSPYIIAFYHLDEAGALLFRVLIVSFFLSSLKTIPSILLERRLDFNKLVIPQILETLGFYVVAVILAWQGFGIMSFTWAVITRALVGLLAIYIVSPWRISLGLSLPVAKKLLHFGVPFQLNSFLALVKDDLLTIFLGKVLPFTAVGYIGWAKKWAEVPLRLIMDSVIRVTFPAFSRLQHSKELLKNAIEKTLFGLSILIFPITTGLLFFMHPLILTIPRYNKWEPAMVSFYLFALSSVVASLSTPLTNALNAVGKIKVTLWLMVLWTVTTWIFTTLFVQLFGFNGVALALLTVSSSIVLVVALVKRVTAFSFIQSTRSAFISACIQGIWYVMIQMYVPSQLGWIITAGFSGVILYGSVLWILESHKIKQIIANLYTPS